MAVLTSDNFATVALNADIFDRTPDVSTIGAKWKRPSGITFVGDGSGRVMSGAEGAWASIDTGSSDIDINADVTFVNSVTRFTVGAMKQTAFNPTDKAGYVVWNFDTTTLRLSWFDAAGSRTDIGTYSAGVTFSVGPVYAMRLVVEGTSIKFYVNGTERISVTDSNVTVRPFARLGGFGTGSNNSDTRYDNFVVNTVGGSAPTLTTPTATATSATTSSGSVSTDQNAGTLYWLTNTSSTATVAAVKAGSSQTVTAAGTQSTTSTGLTASTTYYTHFVHSNGGLDSTVATSASFTTPAPSDVTPPTMNGSITVGTKTSGSISISYPAASDNVAVTGYEVRVNGGTWLDNGTSLSYTALGLTALTSCTIDVRAYDAAGNRAVTPLTVTTSTYREGDTAANIIANTGPVGGNPEGFMRAFAATVSPTDWVSYRILSGPTPPGGTLTANPDGSFTYFGPDAASMVIQPEVNMVDAAETITVTLYDQTVDPDTEPPVLTGSITVTSLTSTGYNLSWPTGTDNIGVTAYEYSLNGGSSWTSQAGTSVSITGRTPESTDEVRVRAKDAAGNVSTPALSTSVTLLAAPDVTAPLLTSPTGAKLGANGAVGSVSTNEANGTLYSLISTDNTLIDVDDDPFWIAVGKQTQSVTAIGTQNVTFGGLAPLTTYTIYFGHEDAAGNRSNVARSLSLTTDAAGAVVTSKFNDGKAMRSCMWHPMKKAINA